MWVSVVDYMDPYQECRFGIFYLDYDSDYIGLPGDDKALLSSFNAAGCLDSGLL